MLRDSSTNFKYDWFTILIYICILCFGYINIIAASHKGHVTSYFDVSQLYGKHLIFIAISFILNFITLSVDTKFYERFSSLIYLFSILSLIGLFVFGKDVNGARSWYAIGNITIQPSEFTKFATVLAVSKFISDFQTNIKKLKDQLRLLLIIFLPALLILFQNDAGSTLIYISFIFVLYREGLQRNYIVILVSLLFISILNLKHGTFITLICCCIIVSILFYRNRKVRYAWLKYIGLYLLCIGFSFGITFFYNNVLKTHQQNRIDIFLKLHKDPAKLEEMKRVEAYNLIQSEKAIISGGLTGKGFLQGTRTIGKFVPEQHTDYIFSTVGEEWGFFGTSIVVILFVTLILRIIYLAEIQKNQFNRVYGYGVASMIFLHFSVNIGMCMGLVPTIGIPLPFFSYGGSSLVAFSILLFIFIKLDGNKVNEL